MAPFFPLSLSRRLRKVARREVFNTRRVFSTFLSPSPFLFPCCVVLEFSFVGWLYNFLHKFSDFLQFSCKSSSSSREFIRYSSISSYDETIAGQVCLYTPGFSYYLISPVNGFNGVQFNYIEGKGGNVELIWKTESV